MKFQSKKSPRRAKILVVSNAESTEKEESSNRLLAWFSAFLSAFSATSELKVFALIKKACRQTLDDAVALLPDGTSPAGVTPSADVNVRYTPIAAL